ncbi:MAG: hypothetical protein COT16_02995 [Elusimicrobia bacterium CG08_land_8_20_14_0_20_44_26]|nr:MAG: hypothetical protein COT16_02995 [Elusimicrobia bacterium CG08_land_8_20_14_0_20_44_26]
MKVEVNILGNFLMVETGDETAEAIQEAALFLNKKTAEVAKASRSADTIKVALITLLDITADYLKLKDRATSGDVEAGKEIDTLNKKLEEVLNE